MAWTVGAGSASLDVKSNLSMKKQLLFPALAALTCLGQAQAALIISQYVDTNSGTTPKGIELWNNGGSTIDFSTSNLDVLKGTNGGTPSSDFTLNVGTIAAGEVIVIGTSDMGDYLDATFGDGSAGSSSVQFFQESFTFNGDDSLVIRLGVGDEDIFGTPGSDPGASWSGSGVSTANQNIALNAGVTAGSTGFTDPSTRFSTISTTPAGAGGLAGFGVAPVPEPSTALLGSIALLGLLRRKR
ncbi:hypothetical protein N9Z19_00430 [Akkermansiaceae bacterium]|nr:hypothetical protein [Akkermansiaceae bacterium]MDB4568357.1 hypothetical protein [Akkermansiaceae bacterium]